MNAPDMIRPFEGSCVAMLHLHGAPVMLPGFALTRRELAGARSGAGM